MLLEMNGIMYIKTKNAALQKKGSVFNIHLALDITNYFQAHRSYASL